MQIKPPPTGLSDWAELIVVQLAAAIAILIGIWKWLTKPLRKETGEVSEGLTKLRRAFRRESFQLRTNATNIMGMAVKNENEIQNIQGTLTRIEGAINEVKVQGKDNHDDLVDIKERLRAVETELKIRRTNI